MKTLSVALFALGVRLLTPVHSQQADRLVILTYNIQIGTGMDKKVDLARTAAVIKSIGVLNDLANLRSDMPTVFAGDINSAFASEPVKILRQQWTPAAMAEMPTYPANTPRRQIDYVFFRPARAWRVTEVKVVDEAMASDHRPVLAVLEYVP